MPAKLRCIAVLDSDNKNGEHVAVHLDNVRIPLSEDVQGSGFAMNSMLHTPNSLKRCAMWRIPKTTIAIIFTFGFLPFCQAEDTSQRGNLIVRSNWIQFDIIGGRISAHKARHNQNKVTTVDEPESKIHESFSVVSNHGSPSVGYERTDARQHLTIDCIDGDQLEIHREPRGDSKLAAVHFSQPKKGKLSLVVERGQEHRRVHARSFWHLVLAEPKMCSEHLVPILESLRPDWRLMNTAERLEQELMKIAAADLILPANRVNRLVDQLGSDSFRQRQAADRELRSFGQVVFSYLTNLNTSSLSAEQRARIRGIIQSLTVRSADTPQRVSTQLINDASIWLVLMMSDESATREAAVAHLHRIHKRPFEFDPHGDEGTRENQIRRLQHRLGIN